MGEKWRMGEILQNDFLAAVLTTELRVTVLFVGADVTKMADLNKYCNEGYAVFDKDKDQSHSLAEHLRCICPHGEYKPPTCSCRAHVTCIILFTN